MPDTDNHQDKARTAHDKLVSLGVPSLLAAAILGAIYAILVALGIITLPGCTATYTQTADGDVQLHTSIVTPTK